MFGVVLWSDQIRNRAVIWCEDHGDLAFFKGGDDTTPESVEMEPGDLVQFDLSEDRHLRLASNPRLVASDEYPTLARDLKKAGGPVPVAPAAEAGKPSKIITFERKATAPAPVARRARRAV